MVAAWVAAQRAMARVAGYAAVARVREVAAAVGLAMAVA